MNPSIVKLPVLMRRAALAATAAGALLGTSCNLFPPPDPGPGAPGFAPNGPHRYGLNGTQSPNYQEPRATSGNQGQKEIKRDPNNDNINLEPPPPKNTPKPPDTPDTSKPEPSSPPPNVTPAPTPKPAPIEDLPYGTPVVGKQGMVYSPFAEDKGPVDVVGIKRGTKVKCPYTGKTFRVP
jgi:hypothetical protein